jgi:peptidyl-prolyl cis-trans isomerase D
MLQSIRDRSQGWLTWFLVITICLTFALWGIHSYFQGGGAPQLAAMVNGSPITKQQLQSAYEHLRQQQQTQSTSQVALTPANEPQLKRQTLEQLIQAKVLSQAALNSGYRVTQEQLTELVAQIPAFKANGQFSPEQFKGILARIGYTTESFFETLQADILQNQVQLGFVSSAFALPNEVQQIQSLLNQRRDIAYAIIPAEMFKSQVHLTDEQLVDYYKQHQTSEFMTPEQVSISYIELDLNKVVAEQKITEQEIKQYYQDNATTTAEPPRYHLAHILIKAPQTATDQQLQQAQTKLTKLKMELKANVNFEQLVKTYSDDVVSAKENGDLGWLHLSDLDSAIAQTVTKLTKPGLITQPIKTQYGYEVIKLLAIQPAKVIPFEQLKAIIKQRLAQQKAQQIFADLSDKLADLTFSNPNSLNTAAKQLDLNVQQTALFTRNGGDSPLTRNPRVIAAAFNKDVLDGSNSNLIEINPGDVVVLRVNQYKSSTPMPFTNVKSLIEAKLLKQQVQSLVKYNSEQVVAELKAGKTPEEIAKTHQLKWIEVANLARHSESPEMAIVKASFSLAVPAAKNQVASQAVQLPSADYAIILLKNVINVTTKKISAQMNEAFAKQLALSYSQVAYQLYIDHLMKQAKIETMLDNSEG